MENIKELKALLQVPKDIVITTHRNPDGDAIGSSLGLYHFLNKGGHTVRMITPSEYPETFSWMPEVEKMVVYDIDPEYSKELVDRADIIFCLDFNALDRIDKLGELIEPTRCHKVMIDHHLYPEGFADFLLSDTFIPTRKTAIVKSLFKKTHLDYEILYKLQTCHNLIISLQDH